MLRATACVDESDHHTLMYVRHGQTVREPTSHHWVTEMVLCGLRVIDTKGVPKEEWGKAGPTMHRSASVAVTLAVAATVDAFTPHRMLAGARGPEVRAKLVSVSAALLFTHVRCAVWPSAQRGKTEECACAVSARAPADAMSGCESIPGATQLQPTPVVKRADERGPGRN